MAGYVSGNMLDLLHWLPFRQRIIFRIASLVRQCCLSLAPASLRELCCLTPGYYMPQHPRSEEPLSPSPVRPQGKTVPSLCGWTFIGLASAHEAFYSSL